MVCPAPSFLPNGRVLIWFVPRLHPPTANDLCHRYPIFRNGLPLRQPPITHRGPYPRALIYYPLMFSPAEPPASMVYEPFCSGHKLRKGWWVGPTHPSHAEGAAGPLGPGVINYTTLHNRGHKLHNSCCWPPGQQHEGMGGGLWPEDDRVRFSRSKADQGEWY